MGWYTDYIGVFKVNKKIPYEFFYELYKEKFKNWTNTRVDKDISSIMGWNCCNSSLIKYIENTLNLTDETINKIKFDKDPNISKIILHTELIREMAYDITIKKNDIDYYCYENRIKVLSTMDRIKKYINGKQDDIIDKFYNNNKEKYEKIFDKDILKNDNSTLYYCYFDHIKYGSMKDHQMDIVIELLKKYDIIVERGSVHFIPRASYFDDTDEEEIYLEINNNICKYIPVKNGKKRERKM